MLRQILGDIVQNKNLLMLISVSIYVTAVFGVLSQNILIIASSFSLLMIIAVWKNIFNLKFAVILLLIFYIGIINTTLRLKNTDELLSIAPVNSEISGKIISIPQGIHENKPKFFFKVNSIKFNDIKKEFKSEKTLVSVNLENENSIQKAQKFKIYDEYILKGRLSVPFKAGNPSQFDYGNYLQNYNTYSVFYAKDFYKIDYNQKIYEKFLQRINDYREYVMDVHSKYLKSPNLEILGGIVFGEDAVSPSKDIKQSFINSGLLHILAASGMNVGFIYMFFFFILSLFRVNYKFNISVCITMILLYSLMTGLGASVIRATFMLIFVLIGKLIDREAHSISLLSFVALLMLLYNPLFINNVGFQLSFIVTFGLLLMSNLIIKSKNKILSYILGIIFVPIIAQLWVIPIQIFYFNNISLYSVFANIMSNLIVAIVSFGGFLSSLLCAIKPLSNIVCAAFDILINPLITTLVNISDFWGKLPFSNFQTTHPSITQISLYYSVILCFIFILKKETAEQYKKLFKIVVFILTLILFLSFIPIKNNNLEIMAFDVGNADCFLIKTPENKYFMIDTGKSGYNGGKSQAEMIILKYLKDYGIKDIEAIIITHFDNDHCGGTSDLINNLNVKNIYLNELHHNSILAKEIYKTAKSKKVNVILASNNQNVYKNNKLTLVNFVNYGNKFDNDNSINTLLTYNHFVMLFTGDSGERTLEAILNNIPKNITVLKVPHHGASGVINKNILARLNPEYSLISVGENKFDHPNIYTLECLKPSKILRTDINNAIKFKITSNKFDIMNYDIKSRKFIKVREPNG